MNVPGKQHPKRAVLGPKDENAFLYPVMDSHAPPHNDRVKPLYQKALKKNKSNE